MILRDFYWLKNYIKHEIFILRLTLSFIYHVTTQFNCNRIEFNVSHPDVFA